MNGKYRITGIEPAPAGTLKDGAFLVLLHATAVPPHIYVTVGGKLFSLGVNGPRVDSDLEQMLRYIRARRVETLFIQIALPSPFTQDDLLVHVRAVMLAYPRADAGFATCLTPVRDFCSDVYGTGKDGVHLIFDLLPRLMRKKAVTACYHLNLEHRLVNGTLPLNRYSVADVYESIHRARGRREVVG